jgi:hypothetical protein
MSNIESGIFVRSGDLLLSRPSGYRSLRVVRRLVLMVEKGVRGSTRRRTVYFAYLKWRVRAVGLISSSSRA